MVIKLLVILGIVVAIGLCMFAISAYGNDNKELEINGVKLGDLFKVVCSINDEFTLILDTETKFLYLASEDGITPLLDKNGKPKKYKSLGEIIKKEEQ